MFDLSDLSSKYEYDYSVVNSLLNFLSFRFLNKSDPYQIVSFINNFIITNKWEWNGITYYNCKRIEFLIQEKIPNGITERKEVHHWLVNNWQKYHFPVLNDISLN